MPELGESLIGLSRRDAVNILESKSNVIVFNWIDDDNEKIQEILAHPEYSIFCLELKDNGKTCASQTNINVSFRDSYGAYLLKRDRYLIYAVKE
jgi:hypothetical protein